MDSFKEFILQLFRSSEVYSTPKVLEFHESQASLVQGPSVLSDDDMFVSLALRTHLLKPVYV